MADHHLATAANMLGDLAESGRISRRQLLGRATALGLSTPAIVALLAACGDDDEEPTAAATNAATTAARPATTAASPAAGSPASAGQPRPTPARDQTYVYPWASEARTLDPSNAAEAGSLDVVSNCYEGLVAQVARAADIEPRLAQSWDVDTNAQVFTFKLQQGVTFVDGTMMDAEAVKKSFERTLQMNLGPAAPLKTIDRIEAVDQFTVRFTLKESNAYFIENLVQAYIISPTAVEQNDRGGDLGAAWLEEGNTAGTGPYNMTEFRKNETKTMVAFEDYWRGWDGPHVQTVACPIVPEVTTRQQMLERGESHFSRLLPPDVVATLQNVSGVTVEFIPTFWYYSKPINVMKPPTDNLKIRQAILYAFPYEQFLQQVWRGRGSVPNGPVPPDFPGYSESLPPFKQDLERARQLVAESGLSNLTLESIYTETLPEEAESETVLQDALRQIGIDMQVRPVPWSTHFELMSNPNTAVHMANLIVGPSRPDPVFALEWIFASQYIGRPYNWSYYNNPEVDEMLAEARRTLERDRSEQLLQQVAKIGVDEALALWYGVPDRADCYSAKVQNWAPILVGFLGETKWYPIWLAE